MDLNLSFVIPVYNRPDEIKELLGSFIDQNASDEYEIVIVEDGSSISSSDEVNFFADRLNISYFRKENTGPGDSRNYGMRHAKGNYFIILDSDCILPPNYLKIVLLSLNNGYVDCFGGPDAAHQSFTNLQKAINFSMTSFLTTGGIRGNKSSINKFQPRSFNMGISKKAFETSGGFGRIHPGEDPDLSIRLTKLGFKTKLIPEAIVYHKRRISWNKFYIQVRKFGLVRPILSKWHPESSRITYLFPTLFIFGLMFSVIALVFGFEIPFIIFGLYFVLAFIVSLIKSGNFLVAILSIAAIFVQFFGYGLGYLESMIKIGWLNKDPEKTFPNLFFKVK